MRCLVCSLFLLIGLSSCGPTFIVDEYLTVDPEAWTYEDAKKFSFAVQDTQQLYSIHLVMEHSADFFAQNVYIEITTTSPDKTEQKDEVSLQLADKYGSWYGDCSNEKCELDILIQPIVYFDQLGNYEVSIKQHSRKEQLTGVHGLRFQVEERPSKKTK